jgi:ribosomal protein S18 acetylase RimI-like enzyme
MLEQVDLHIRKATELDLPALEWEGEYIHFRHVYREAMKEVKKGRRMILVAETEGQLIGQIFINLHSTWLNSIIGLRTGYLHSFRVKPEYRNRGVGRRLIQTAERALIKQGYHRVVISVAKSNKGALRLYQNLGYRIFRDDPGRWSFLDHNHQVQHISEPASILRKSS